MAYRQAPAIVRWVPWPVVVVVRVSRHTMTLLDVHFHAVAWWHYLRLQVDSFLVVVCT